MSQPTIIGISGYARTGKDTIAGILHDQYGYHQMSFAAALKSVTHDSGARIPLYIDNELTDRGVGEFVDEVGWETAKRAPQVRELLQGLGVAAREHIHEDVWVDAAFHKAPSGPLVFSDVRFPNEFKIIRHRGGVMWRVSRPGVGAINPHISETALNGYYFDKYLDNDGTVEELAQKVISIMQPDQQMQSERILNA